MTEDLKQQIIEEFIQYCKSVLKIDALPPIQFTNDRAWATERHSFGEYDPTKNTLFVYIGNRNLADILRTLGHELVHHKQNELGVLKNGSGQTGSEIENEANSIAGVLMRNYGKTNELIYEIKTPSLKEIYEEEKISRLKIYCDMDGVLCDFDKRFEHFYNVSPLEYRKKYTPNKANEYLTEAVDKVGIQFWTKMPWMPGGKQLWDKISPYNPNIVTSPGNFKFAMEGKKIWIKENLSPAPKNVFFAKSGNKQLVISDKPESEIKNSILIDDYFQNIAPWKELGGIGITHKSFDGTNNILNKFKL
jgi:Zn-dependent peptidase ImmA (M78 family)